MGNSYVGISVQIHVSSILTRCIYADPDNLNKFNQGDSCVLAQRYLLVSKSGYSAIVFYILTVVLSYRLSHLFCNTRAGRVPLTRRDKPWPVNSFGAAGRILWPMPRAILTSLKP